MIQVGLWLTGEKAAVLYWPLGPKSADLLQEKGLQPGSSSKGRLPPSLPLSLPPTRAQLQVPRMQAKTAP